MGNDGCIEQLTQLRGVGPTIAARLADQGIATPLDLLYEFPREYTDRSTVVCVADLTPGTDATILGTLGALNGGGRGWGRPRPVTTKVKDETGSVPVVWFNQPYLAKSLKRGQRVLCTGPVRTYRDALQLSAPQIEVLDEEEGEGEWQVLLPHYRLPDGISDRKVRGWVSRLLEDLSPYPDPIPAALRDEFELVPWDQAMRGMHVPATKAEHQRARERFVFEEFLLFQLRVQSARSAAPQERRAISVASPKAITEFQGSLPFQLTGQQDSLWNEIADRLAQPEPANVLLQGDVGTGKTLLALQAILAAIRSGVQAALMAPTAVLADQHAATVQRLLGPHGVAFTTLTGGLKASDRRVRREALAQGDVPLVIGTHALFEEGVQFDKLGLVIIDEQHRFGVMQRARLQQKGYAPHLVVMTATPIPRSLALTLYGEFDRLTLTERPVGRQPITTEHLGDAPGKQWIERVRAELDAGRQAYWVCPLVNEPEEDGKGKARIAATTQIERLRAGPLKQYHLGLLHGGMSSQEKSDVMRVFSMGDIQVLVCTSVIEVGVDVPNASVMVIEEAQRFGLAQLHQLRGRLGRGEHPGLCLLRGLPTTTSGEERIKVLLSTVDGFEIAAHDLALRGPGEFLGVRQSGIPRLRLGHLIHDAELMDTTAACARELLTRNPRLDGAELTPLRARLGDQLSEELWL